MLGTRTRTTAHSEVVCLREEQNNDHFTRLEYFLTAF